MGGHGGLNILPQKRWNVYNFDNREKVRRDEEEAAKEEQLKREQSRKRDAEFRLDRLRASRGLVPPQSDPNPTHQSSDPNPPHESSDPNSPKSGHINLFEGIKILEPVKVAVESDGSLSRKKKMKKEVVVAPEDEKYRFGYSYVGKEVKLPWYLQNPNDDDDVDVETSDNKGEKNKSGKKTLEELREERLKRERSEKERERALIREKQKSDRHAYGSRRFSSSNASIPSNFELYLDKRFDYNLS